MPEATVHENYKMMTWKYQVRRTRQVTTVQAEPTAECMSPSAHCHLWGGMARPNPRHDLAPSLNRDPVSHRSPKCAGFHENNGGRALCIRRYAAACGHLSSWLDSISPNAATPGRFSAEDRFSLTGLLVPTRVVPPSASALITSLRGVGYSLETAVADIVDNSIAASAKRVDIHWNWQGGDPVAAIIDDGSGMSEARLLEAMRFGGVGPDAPRGEQDLGRFGLGLKTASLSQCRQLTVISKHSNLLSSFTWDLDHIRKHGDAWNLIVGHDGLQSAFAHDIKNSKSGTLVAWRKIDFGRREDRPDHAAFLGDLARLECHLGMVFHRFLRGDAQRLSICVNGREVEPWDPFLEHHEATIRNPEQQITGPGGKVRVRGFVLPHRDRFQNETEFEKAGGPEGWTAQQGFYVYRQKRLLSAGGWLGLGGSRAWTRDEPSRLARIRVDIPNTADHDWRIDIRKAIARPPDAIRKPLQQISNDIRRKAREVFVHRGQYGARPRTNEVSRLWCVNPLSARRRYRLRRDHELVELIRERLPSDSRDLFDSLLDLVERTVPVDRVWLDVTEHGVPSENTDIDELVEAALSMARMMEKAGVRFQTAAERLQSMDPFDKIDRLADLLLEKAGKVRR